MPRPEGSQSSCPILMDGGFETIVTLYRIGGPSCSTGHRSAVACAGDYALCAAEITYLNTGLVPRFQRRSGHGMSIIAALLFYRMILDTVTRGRRVRRLYYLSLALHSNCRSFTSAASNL
jgi:hypothetical protein